MGNTNNHIGSDDGSEEYYILRLKDPPRSGIINIAKHFGKDPYDIFYDELVKIEDDKPLRIYIESDGGDMLSLQKIVRNLRRRTHKVSIYIEKSAHSAGTVLALACDEIYMNQDASLSAIDPQNEKDIVIDDYKFKSIKLIPLLCNPNKETTIANIIIH